MNPAEIAAHLNTNIERLAALIGVSEEELLAPYFDQANLPLAIRKRIGALEDLVRRRKAGPKGL